MRSSLREHQQRALLSLRQSLAHGRKRPLVCAPTGAGKTVLAAAIVDGALRKGNRVIFTVPRLSLIDQTVEALWREGIADVGVIQGSHEMTNGRRPVQVASVQTLQRRAIPEADVVVVDEAHEIFRLYRDWMSMDAWRNVPFIGLSATPWSRGLGKLYDDLIVAATTQELIDAGYLSPFRVFAPSHPDLTGVRTKLGDYHEGDLAGAMDKPGLTADVVETWRRLGGDRPTLCFAVNCAHARGLQRQFQGAGIACGYADAHTPLDEREALRRAFHNGEIKVICNVGVLVAGVDWDVRCIILARPTKSEIMYVQAVGRGLRTAPGKDDLIILDHSDTTLRLGFVTDIWKDRLDDGSVKEASASKKNDPPLPKECPSCSFLKPAKISLCPHCGFKPERAGNIECEDGDLIEVKGKKRPTPDEKRSFYAQLLGYARDRGKSDKWVLAHYRAKYQEWPYKKHVPSEPPGPEVIGFIHHRRIAFAKSKTRSHAA